MKLIQGKMPLQAAFLLLAITCSGSHRSNPISRLSCHPINATIAAEKDNCPFCTPVTTAICGGYCETKASPFKISFSSLNQRVCTYKEVRYETLLLRGCAAGVDPTFTYPVALSCHCDICKMESSDCSVESMRPDYCSNPHVFTS